MIDALTLDVYLFHAMLRGMMPLVWNVGSNLTHPTSPQLQGMLYQVSPTATRCNTLHHAAIRCNTLHFAVIRCKKL